VSWRVFGEPSDVSKDKIPATRDYDEVQYWAEAGE